MKRNKGFTLIELMIIILIIAIVLAMIFDITQQQRNPLETALAETPEGNCYVRIDDSHHAHQIAEFVDKHPEFEIVSDAKGRLLLKRKGCTSSTKLGEKK